MQAVHIIKACPSLPGSDRHRSGDSGTRKIDFGSMADGGGQEGVSSKMSMEESMEQGQIVLDESGNLMDVVKIGAILAIFRPLEIF